MKTIKRSSTIAAILCSMLFIALNSRHVFAGDGNKKLNDGDTTKGRERIDCVQTMGTHLQDFGKASTYIYDYVKDPVYKNFAISEGGWIEISRERLPEFEPTKFKFDLVPHCGLLCYFLFNLEGSAKFEIAHNYVDDLYVGDEPHPSAGDFRISDYNYHFTAAEIDNPQVLSRKIVAYSHQVTNQNKDKAYNIVKTANDSFVDKIHDITKVKFAAGFIHKQQIMELLTQNDSPLNANRRLVCKGIRIYWGYDDTTKPYAIRMVIFGIDDDGYNILSDYTGKKHFIFERSWPPDEAH